jgi:hypothetical protein
MKQMLFLRFDAAGFRVDREVPRDPSSPRRVFDRTRGCSRGLEEVEKLRGGKDGVSCTT